LATTPHPFGNQTALVLRNGTTNLQEKLIVGVITHRAIQKFNATAAALQLIDQQHLMHVLTG